MSAIHPGTRIGHVHLTVSDLASALRFYRDILGFEVTQDAGSVVFLSAGGYHHHIGLNVWSGKGAKRPEDGHIGLYHYAILYPTRKELADALRRLLAAQYPIEGSADHGVSQALYLKDPDGNGVELYADMPEAQWPRDARGKALMHTRPLDLKRLLRES